MTQITSVLVETDDGMEGDEPGFPWLPPDDRLWRHPSEAAEGTTRTAVAPSAYRETERRLWAVALLAGMVGAVLASGAGVVAGQYHRTTTVVKPIEQIVGPSNPYVTIAADPKNEDIVDLAARLRPTIVELLVSTNGGNGSGSGIIFRSDGYILTNNHVVEGALSVVAVLSNGHRVTCRLVGSDRSTDIAVVKMLDGKPQSIAQLGTSAQLKVGQMAIAIGSPPGLAGGMSVTSGIISAVDRQVNSWGGAPLIDMIQTNAAIEPGSSGGALVDASGMVIGLTTAITFGDQSMQALGFATPIEVAHDVANQLLSTGRATHAWLGVTGADVDGATAKALSISGGAFVSNVDSGSPAARAGVVPTDVVTAVEDQPVDTMSALEMNVRLRRPGDHVSIRFVHDGVVHITGVVLLERPRSDYP